MNEFFDEKDLVEFEHSYNRKDQIVEELTEFFAKKDVKSAKLLIEKSHIADIADIIEVSDDNMREKIFDLLGQDFNPHLLAEIADNAKLATINIIGKDQFIKKINQLPIDEAADVIYGFHDQMQQMLIDNLSPEKKKFLLESLSYKENTAGRIMDPEVISVPSYWTIRATIDYLKGQINLPEDYYEIFIVDGKNKPIGSILTSRLLRADRSKRVAEIMNRHIRPCKVNDDKGEVAYLFKQYALVSVPVVTGEDRLVGQITIDEIIEIIEEEVEDDIMKLSGIGKKPKTRSSALTTALRRLPWLFLNLCTAFLTSSVITNFSETIQQLVVLAAIMPIVASLGGNAGTQSLTFSVRGIANRNITSYNSLKIIFKEMLASLCNGLLIALLGGIFISLFFHDFRLGILFGIAVILNFTVAGFFGSSIPFIMKKLGFDPALGSGVFLTALTDTTGFFSFLGLASLLLK